MTRLAGRIIALVLPLVLLSAAAATVVYLFRTAPEVERSPQERQLPLVQAIPVSESDVARVVEAFGTVEPARQVELQPEVSGRVTQVHPALAPGGLIAEGEVLLKIDPEEYELALSQARSGLAEAEAALEVEQGRQLVARREWELFGKDIPDAELGEALALRRPQLRQAEAAVESASVAVRQAELDLRRTEIHAPFDVLVLEESVETGQRVDPGSTVAELVGSGAFWVKAALPADRLDAVLPPEGGAPLSARIYRDLAAVAEEPVRGVLLRHLGQVDPLGRQALVLVEVSDPLGTDSPRNKRHPLPLNTYVRVELDAGVLEGVVRVPRRALRENNEVWIADAADRLQTRTVDVLWRQDTFVVVPNTFAPGDRLVTSPVGDLLPGAEVRVSEPEGAA